MKKHFPLIIAILLPILFIVIISIIIYVPSLFLKPQYNFIYSMNNPETYGVENDHLVQGTTTRAQNSIYQTSATLYLYNVTTNTSNQITFDEAKNYIVNPGPSSPDGYIIKYEYDNNDIFDLFGSNNDTSGYFLEKDNEKKELAGLVNAGGYGYYQDNFNFIGWIK